VQNEQDQKIQYRIRDVFKAELNCTRNNASAPCNPLADIWLNFSSDVPQKFKSAILLKSANGKIIPVTSESSNESEDLESGDGKVFNYLKFKAPFEASHEYTLELSSDLVDDDSRPLENKTKFPLKFKTDAYPALAKFASKFGVVERFPEAVLPVTIRSLESDVRSRLLEVANVKKDTPLENVQGQSLRLSAKDASEIVEWMKIVERSESEVSVFSNPVNSAKVPKALKIPSKLKAGQTEVIGIPLKENGFHVIEMESNILGRELLAKDAPYYVPTSALVTNLNVSLKEGRESSLVFVSTLDKAMPVKGAKISFRNCHGDVFLTGVTDASGVFLLHEERDWEAVNNDKPCSSRSNKWSSYNNGYFVFAETDDDFTFSHSSWNEGIENWRFQTRAVYGDKRPLISSTLLDRSLLKPGEKVSMKHFIRRHESQGFALPKSNEWPKFLMIIHSGSSERFEFPLEWKDDGTAESSWTIPKTAKLGYYTVYFTDKSSTKEKGASLEESEGDYYRVEGWDSAGFRVEEFRIPLMKGVLQIKEDTLLSPKSIDVDLAVQFLAGGGADSLPVDVSYKLQSTKNVPALSGERFEDFSSLTFGSEKSLEEELAQIRRGSNDSANDRTLIAEKKEKITLDSKGGHRLKVSGYPSLKQGAMLSVNAEFRDPNGERYSLYDAQSFHSVDRAVGVKFDESARSKDKFRFQVGITDLKGQAVVNEKIEVTFQKQQNLSHRKRIVGGFYSYEHQTVYTPVKGSCVGKSDDKGLVHCEVQLASGGNIYAFVKLQDSRGQKIEAYAQTYVYDKNNWWFAVDSGDRMDLIPDRKKWEPGEKARIQVRSPFKNSTVLVSIEREGLLDYFVTEISNQKPYVEVPLKKNFSPNVIVSVLAMRGRDADTSPTSMIDLGKPSYKLGMTELFVGWKNHELKVSLKTDKENYLIGQKSQLEVLVKDSEGRSIAGSEVAIAAVDKGLLLLQPNDSWDLLSKMMNPRGHEVKTTTMAGLIVGKRHFGLKALPTGGGGGAADGSGGRQNFDTLLLWKGRVKTDSEGKAKVEIPLNDSVTQFEIVAIAHAGIDKFGTGNTQIRTTQDLVIYPSLSLIAREGDELRSEFTVRNASTRSMSVQMIPKIEPIAAGMGLASQNFELKAGESKVVSWVVKVPVGVSQLKYHIQAIEKGGAKDEIKVSQKVIEAVPVRVIQATLSQLEKEETISLKKAEGSVDGKGAVVVKLASTLNSGLDGVKSYMTIYPYSCLEQQVSKFVSLGDDKGWKKLAPELSNYLDPQGFVKYFPSSHYGSVVLSSYVLAIAHEAGWAIPESTKARMLSALLGFAEGKIFSQESYQTTDQNLRRLMALEAVTRYQKVSEKTLEAIDLNTDLLPTASLLDYLAVARRILKEPARSTALEKFRNVLKARMNFQGTVMSLSSPMGESFWWLMVSEDTTANRLLLQSVEDSSFHTDIGRIVRGALSRQKQGHWDLSVANAWGTLAMKKFSKVFEKESVTGQTAVSYASEKLSLDWSKAKVGIGKTQSLEKNLAWAPSTENLVVKHLGTGKPWFVLQAKAALPLKEAFSSGYKISKSLIPIQVKDKNQYSIGDVWRVKVDVDAQTDMGWVVVQDPIPAGATLLGTGLGGDSSQYTQGESREGWVWPMFEEKAADALRSYYDFVPKGKFSFEYTMRINQAGHFQLPNTHVEAMYSPELFGDLPNASMKVVP